MTNPPDFRYNEIRADCQYSGSSPSLPAANYLSLVGNAFGPGKILFGCLVVANLLIIISQAPETLAQQVDIGGIECLCSSQCFVQFPPSGGKTALVSVQLTQFKCCQYGSSGVSPRGGGISALCLYQKPVCFLRFLLVHAVVGQQYLKACHARIFRTQNLGIDFNGSTEKHRILVVEA